MLTARRQYTFMTNCVASDGKSINDMTHAATQIKRSTFLKRVDRSDLREIEKCLGYDRGFPMSKDWHVSYHKSTYQGQPCIYFVWSAIEYVFVG